MRGFGARFLAAWTMFESGLEVKMRILRSVCLSCLALPMLAACADDAPAIFVKYNGLPDENCVPDPGGNSYKTSGTLDLLIGTSYVMYPVLQNNLVPSESVSFARPAGGGGLNGAESEMNTITLTRAEVKLNLPSTLQGVAESRKIPLSGSAKPGEEFALDLTVIPSNIGSNLQLNPAFASGDSVEIGVQVTFYGETISGNEVTSNVFNFPISLCRGCGIVYPPEANTADSGVPNCSNLDGVSDSSARTSTPTAVWSAAIRASSRAAPKTSTRPATAPTKRRFRGPLSS
jgi:hypothetical protein